MKVKNGCGLPLLNTPRVCTAWDAATPMKMKLMSVAMLPLTFNCWLLGGDIEFSVSNPGYVVYIDLCESLISLQ
jgi:hypothetical protein